MKMLPCEKKLLHEPALFGFHLRFPRSIHSLSFFLHLSTQTHSANKNQQILVDGQWRMHPIKTIGMVLDQFIGIFTTNSMRFKLTVLFLVGGHLILEKVTVRSLNHPKKVTKNCQIAFEMVPFQVTFVHFQGGVGVVESDQSPLTWEIRKNNTTFCMVQSAVFHPQISWENWGESRMAGCCAWELMTLAFVRTKKCQICRWTGVWFFIPMSWWNSEISSLKSRLSLKMAKLETFDKDSLNKIQHLLTGSVGVMRLFGKLPWT